MRWGTGPYRFELTVPAGETARRAREVLAPWHAPRDAGTLGAWRLAPAAPGAAGAEEGWSLESAAVDPDSGPARHDFADLDSALHEVELRASGGLLRARAPGTTVHGALLARDGRGVLVAGASQTGKSTLACLLWSRGWDLLTDDLTLIDPETQEAFPSPRRPSLRAASAALLPGDLWRSLERSPGRQDTAEGFVCHPRAKGRARSRGPVRIDALFFLERSGARRAQPVESIAPADALLSLIAYSNAEPRQAGEALAGAAPLLRRVPAWDLTRAAPEVLARRIATTLEEHS